MIAALFVQRNGAYWGLPEVDPWDETRDARKYDGPWPVVAHPPCSRWCRLAGVVEARWGYKRGEDGGCFAAALRAVRMWGGVLEHPAWSKAWSAFNLIKPTRGHWTKNPISPEWTTEVSQSAYGHRARKRTWLYYYGRGWPPDLDWSDPAGDRVVGSMTRRADGTVWRNPRARMTKREASATPPAFRDLLLSLARWSER